jgi:coproporphyrinogen III oxidase
MIIYMRQISSEWFEQLRNSICEVFEDIEREYADKNGLNPQSFKRKDWSREGGGGGQISIMRGNVFEKVGVNISTVYGEFSEKFAREIPGAEKDPKFFATGVSLVAHMKSPLVPAAHFNTRFIETSQPWFGGGGDMTPTFIDPADTAKFHNSFKIACDKYNKEYYLKFKKNCDEYFYLPHRSEHRGVGGIFYDYLNSGNQEEDFRFTKDVGTAFRDSFSEIVRSKMYLEWSEIQREALLEKRGRYVEFNLLYDRGTKFGLMTGGNTEAILMSMPPEVKWP